MSASPITHKQFAEFVKTARSYTRRAESYERALKQQALGLLDQGVSKTALAEALGVSRQTVYNWIREAENGG